MEISYDEYTLNNVIIWHRCIVKHFKTPKYDCIKKEYHIKGNETYIKNNIKGFKPHFKRLMTNFTTPTQVKLFFIVCCMNDVNSIYDINEKFVKLLKVYKQRLQVYDNLESNFLYDVSYIKKRYGSINNSIKVREGMFSGLLNCFFKKEIQVETLLILDNICNLFRIINKSEKENILWEHEYQKIYKYGSFINQFDTELFKSILLEK